MFHFQKFDQFSTITQLTYFNNSSKCAQHNLTVFFFSSTSPGKTKITEYNLSISTDSSKLGKHSLPNFTNSVTPTNYKKVLLHKFCAISKLQPLYFHKFCQISKLQKVQADKRSRVSKFKHIHVYKFGQVSKPN
jgi:hypothetical protein